MGSGGPTHSFMTNIPTELLRTLVTVVELRSFTKAAQALGVTQPAVSAQIKRLQLLLGSEILDKSAPGVSLTPTGERVVNHARRLLSINDDILDLAMPRPASQTIRVGVPADFVSPHLPWVLAEFRTRWPDVRFNVHNDYYDALARDLRHGEIDLYVALSTVSLPDARHQWVEEMAWVRSQTHAIDPGSVLALVSLGETCVLHQVMVQTLNNAARPYDLVYIGSSIASLAAAVSVGLGITALTRSRVATSGLTVWEDAPLPRLPDLFCSIHIREGSERLAQLSDAIADTLNPARQASADPQRAALGILF